MIRRGPVRGTLLSVAVAASLLLGVTGCGGDEDKDGVPDDYEVVAGTELCGGNAVSSDAAKALKVITGSSRFEASGEEYTVKQAAADVVGAYPRTTMFEDACRVYTPLGTPDFELRITWDLVDQAPTSTADPDYTVLKMGEETLTAPDKAIITFACQSNKLGNSDDVHIAIGVRRGGMPKPPEGDVEELKDAYATVAHSFALAMAKELGCKNNGGLPAKPVLDPA